MANNNGIRAAGLVFISVFAFACGNGKSEQCKVAIDAYNVVGETMRKGFGDGTDPDAIDAHIKEVENATKAFVGLDVSDSGLKTARNNLATVFRTHTTTLTKMAGLIREAKDPAKADAALTKINAIAAEFEGVKTTMLASKQAFMTECNATSK
jgi:hypothetical protein